MDKDITDEDVNVKEDDSVIEIMSKWGNIIYEYQNERWDNITGKEAVNGN